MKLLSLSFLLFLPTTLAAESITENSPIKWTLGLTIDSTHHNYQGPGINFLLDGGISHKELELTCKLSLDKDFLQSQKKKKIYVERLWVECEHKGVRIAMDAVSCTSSDTLESQGLNFTKGKFALRIQPSCSAD